MTIDQVHAVIEDSCQDQIQRIIDRAWARGYKQFSIALANELESGLAVELLLDVILPVIEES